MRYLCKINKWLIGVLGFVQLGCAGPVIQSFEITPQVLCPGESAIASWDARSKTRMTFLKEPEAAASTKCAARGKEAFLFRLIAEGESGQDEKHVEVVQLRPNGAEPIVFSTNRLENDQVVASGVKNPELWAEHVRIASLASCDSRDIQVRHAGRTATLPANGTRSDALAGTPLTGEWELRSVLSSDELRNPAVRPKQLEILADFTCAK